MAFFSNKRKDFSIQLPKQSIANGAFTVTDSANIDFTYALNNLTANLTTTGILAGTYGDATHIPILTLDSYGRVTGVTTVAIGGGGGTYTVDNGLTESPANNFQLGGTLIQNTTITESTYNLLFTATNKESLYLNSGYTTNNNLKPVLKLYRSVLGGVDGANNIGGSIEFKSSAAAGLISQPIVTDLILASVATNSDPQINRETQFEAWVNYQNILTKVITSSRNLTRIDGRITELGATQHTDIESQFILSSYGLGAYTGTLAYTLGVDASGNVIEFTGGGGGTVTNVSSTVPSPTSPAFSVLVTNPTTTPAIDITANGTISQYVRGDASLGTTVTKTSELYNDGDNGTSHFISLEDLPSNLTLYATNVASGISTYTKAVSSLTDPDYNSVAVNIPVGPLTSTTVATACGGIISSANIIVGNPGIFTMSTIGNVRRTGGTAEGIFYYEIYKRDSGGTETLIVASSNTIPVSTSTYTEFNAAALFNNGVFTATDRVVIKFYGLRLSGGSNPSFDFQFGGTAPVRTTLPIPLVVTPANGVTSVATGTGLTGGPITGIGTISLNTKLAPADSLAGNSLKYLRVNLLETAVEYETVTGGGGDSIGQLTGDVDTILATSSTEVMPSVLAASYKKGSASVVFDGAGGVITSGTTAYAQVLYNGTITSWTIAGNVSGSCTVTVFKDTYANFPPIISSDNVFTVQPALATQQKNQNLAPVFVGSQATVVAGDWIGFTISGITTLAWVNLTIAITKTV